MRSYFDPINLAGKKHKFIRDLKTDYDFDNLIYGLGKYATDSPIRARPQHLEPHYEEVPIISLPQATLSKRNIKAKLRDISILRIVAPMDREEYEGLFSKTKLIRTEVLNAKRIRDEKAIIERDLSPWNTESIGVVGSNPAAGKQPTLKMPQGRRKVVASEEKLQSVKLDVRRPAEDLTQSATLHDSLLRHSSKSPSPELEKSAEPLFSSVKIGSDEPIVGYEPRADILVLECSKQVQSPFSDHPMVHYHVTVPKVSIKMLSENWKDLSTTYILQLTDLSVPGYPLAQLPNLFCTPDSPWLRGPSGFKEIDLCSLITDYESVHRHTIRLVLLARGEKRRLIERLLHFGARDWKSEARVAKDLTNFAIYLKSTPKVGGSVSPQAKKRVFFGISKAGLNTYQCLVDGEKRATLIKPSINASMDTMKMATPRRLFPLELSSSPQKDSEKHFPGLRGSASKPRPLGDYKHPITNALMTYRGDDFMYKREQYATNLIYLEEWDKRWKTGGVREEVKQSEDKEEEQIMITGQTMPTQG